MTIITEKGRVIEIPAQRSPLLRNAALRQVQDNLARAFPECITRGCKRRAVVDDEYCYACAQTVPALQPIFADNDGAWRGYAVWALRLWKRFEWVFLLAFVAWGLAEFALAEAGNVAQWIQALKNSIVWGK